MKKKILVFFPSVNLYGKERSNYEVFKILQDSQLYELTLLSNARSTDELKEKFREFSNIYIRFPQRTGRLRYIRYLVRMLLDVAYVGIYTVFNKFDCIYINNEMTIYDFYPILKFVNKPIIYRIGDVPAFPTIAGYKYNYFMWNSIVNKKIDTIISISHFIKSEVERYGRDSDNDFVIYNYPPRREEFKELCQKKPGKNLRVGYLGQIRELKGVHILIDAVISMIENDYDIELYLAGSTSVFKEYADSLKQKVERSSKPALIHFLDEINDVASFFQSIDVLCVPTIWPEALGNVIVEAKQNHTPVIVFPSGGMPELITNGVDGFICEGKDKESIMKILNNYINNPSLLETQSEESFNSLERLKITYHSFTESWLSVFKNCLP